ncbi:hypothetical protein GN956_G4474 [Arapaima gigas]
MYKKTGLNTLSPNQKKVLELRTDLLARCAEYREAPSSIRLPGNSTSARCIASSGPALQNILLKTFSDVIR